MTLDTLFGGSALNCIYGAALLIGFFYALFLLFFQGVGNAFDIGDIELFGHDIDLSSIFDVFSSDIDLDGDLDVSSDGSEVSGLSMLALSGFTTSFGAFGLVSTTFLNASPLLSLIIASIAGVLVGAAAQVFFVQVLSVSTSTNVQIDSIKGATAEVIVPIPEKGLGQIAFVLSGQRITLSARTSTTAGIARGAQVIVDSVRDNVAYVSPDAADDV